MRLSIFLYVLSYIATALAVPGCGTKGLTQAELDQLKQVEPRGIGGRRLATRNERITPRQNTMKWTLISTYIHVFSSEARFHPTKAQIQEQVTSSMIRRLFCRPTKFSSSRWSF